MSWLFSQVLVEGFLPATFWDGARSAQLNVMPTPHKFWRNDRTMEFCRLSQFGLTCAVLTVNAGEALLMSFLAASRAKTYLVQVPALESKALALDFGRTWLESSAKYCPKRSSWRTHQCLWDEDLPWSLVTLPRWGTTRNGVLYQRRISERPIDVSASGSLEGETTRPLQHWPTPVASMSKGSSPNALQRRSGANRSKDRLDHTVMALHGGQLNPDWVEWLMGWPSGWTALKPLEMVKFHEWQQQHTAAYVQGIGRTALVATMSPVGTDTDSPNQPGHADSASLGRSK